MATVRIVPEEHWNIIKEYLSDIGVVLVKESVVNTLSPSQKERILHPDGGEIEYDFGGDADVWVDFVSSTDHMFWDYVFLPDEEMDEVSHLKPLPNCRLPKDYSKAVGLLERPYFPLKPDQYKRIEKIAADNNTDILVDEAGRQYTFGYADGQDMLMPIQEQHKYSC